MESNEQKSWLVRLYRGWNTTQFHCGIISSTIKGLWFPLTGSPRIPRINHQGLPLTLPPHPRYVGKEDGSVEPQKIHTVVISTQHAEPSKAVRTKVQSGLSGWQWMMAKDEVSWGCLVGPGKFGGEKPRRIWIKDLFFPGEWKILGLWSFVSHVFFYQVFCWLPRQVVFVLFLEEMCKKWYENYEIGSVNCWMFERLPQYIHIHVHR